MVIDRPLTGVGLNCFGVANATGYSPESQRSWLQPHSLYVQVPAEIGVVGALVFFAFLFEVFRLNAKTQRSLRKRGRDWEFEETVLRGIQAGLVALLVAGIFGHSFGRYTWYVYGAIVVASVRLQAGLAPDDLARPSHGAT